jgi:RHS repeat-associated protein
VVTRAVGGVEWGYVYDPENRLKEVWRGSERVAFFRYDGEGNRVVREVGGIRTVGVDEGYELRNGGVRKVYRLGGERVAVREGSTVYAAVGDHLGSVTVLAQGGSVAGATRYLPYGAIRWESGLWSTDRRFTGQRWEQGLGLYDYRARFYDPTLGRFLQPDPIVPEPGNPQALNRYAYVYNNPLRYTDPSGHVVDPPQCPWCDRPWISLAGWPPLAVNLAQLGCALLSCHVDHATQMIWGPTTIDWMEAQTLSVAQVGMPASLPTGGLPDIAQREWIRVRLIQRLGETLQPYLKRLEEILMSLVN